MFSHIELVTVILVLDVHVAVVLVAGVVVVVDVFIVLFLLLFTVTDRCSFGLVGPLGSIHTSVHCLVRRSNRHGNTGCKAAPVARKQINN